MKVLLTMIMCSGLQGMCLTPHPLSYHDTMYDCLMSGYEEASKKQIEVGREETKKHEIFVKFSCTWERVNEI
mgnify:FL=1|jgi:hypothetical protein|tara:strand:+ start:64 stop:279 length:216 start_codon:yes stop_codon:yes gene_type:complete